jgi:hypothetical protein
MYNVGGVPPPSAIRKQYQQFTGHGNVGSALSVVITRDYGLGHGSMLNKRDLRHG